MQEYLTGFLDGDYSTSHFVSNTPEQIAAFIMSNRFGNAKLVDLFDQTVLETLGGFIDYALDQRFLRDQLLPILVPMQRGEKELIPYVPYVDNNYIIKAVVIPDKEGYHVSSLNILGGYPKETFLSDKNYATEEEAKADYPEAISIDEAEAYADCELIEREDFKRIFIRNVELFDNIQDKLDVKLSNVEIRSYKVDEESFKNDFGSKIDKLFNEWPLEDLRKFALGFQFRIKDETN